jgi:hypothetical protein
MITLGIILLILYVISIYKVKKEDWGFHMVDEIWEHAAFAGTIVILITLVSTLIILMVEYLP